MIWRALTIVLVCSACASFIYHTRSDKLALDELTASFTAEELENGERFLQVVLRSTIDDDFVQVVGTDELRGGAGEDDASTEVMTPYGLFDVETYSVTLPAGEATRLFARFSRNGEKMAIGSCTLPPRLGVLQVQGAPPSRAAGFAIRYDASPTREPLALFVFGTCIEDAALRHDFAEDADVGVYRVSAENLRATTDGACDVTVTLWRGDACRVRSSLSFRLDP